MYINLHTRSHIYLKKISIFCKKMIAFSSSAHLMEKSTFLPKFQFFSHKIDIFAPKLILTETLVTLPQRLHDIILGEMLTFSLSVHYYWKWLSFCKICLFLEKMWHFVSNSDKKKYNFLIFIKEFHLSENFYFDSKYHFIQWYFGQECHFPSKIYITLCMNSLEKSSHFLRKVLIYLSILGKMTIGFRSILVVNSEENNNLFYKC